MSDKLRCVYPIAISFYDGERPSAAKLNGVSKQARNGLSIVEYAIGDLWNQSGDALFSNKNDAHLMIPNLARYVGSPKHLNPYIPNLSVSDPYYIEYTHIFANEVNSRTARLPFPVLSTSSFTWIHESATLRDSTPKSTPDLVVVTGNWYLDYATGDIIAYDAFAATDRLTYYPAYYDTDGAEIRGIHGDLGEDKTFNIIPDPDTSTAYAFGGLKIQRISGTTDDYYVYLPPRGPLNTRIVDGSPQDSYSDPNNTYNFSSGGSPFTFWLTDSIEAPTTDANEASHYRYKLPKLLTDNQSPGSMFPTGFLYLYDPTYNKTIIEGITFYANNTSVNSYTLIAKGANLTSWLSTTGAPLYTSDMLENPSHTAAYYPPNGLKLITVGTSLSEAFASLMKQFLNHDHSSQGSLVSKMVEHNKLNNLFDRGDSAPYFRPSALTNDDHPQYLHRTGYTTDRDNGNAMLGDLVLAAATIDGGTFLNTTQTSNKLCFGKDSSGGPSIYWNGAASANRLVVDIPSSIIDPSFVLSASNNTLFTQITETDVTITSSADLNISAGTNNIILNSNLNVGSSDPNTQNKIYVLSSDEDYPAVKIENISDGMGLYASSVSGSAICGRSDNSPGRGVYGYSAFSDGVYGATTTGTGVKGVASDVTGIGIEGTNFQHINNNEIVIEVPLTCGHSFPAYTLDDSPDDTTDANDYASAPSGDPDGTCDIQTPAFRLINRLSNPNFHYWVNSAPGSQKRILVFHFNDFPHNCQLTRIGIHFFPGRDSSGLISNINLYAYKKRTIFSSPFQDPSFPSPNSAITHALFSALYKNICTGSTICSDNSYFNSWFIDDLDRYMSRCMYNSLTSKSYTDTLFLKIEQNGSINFSKMRIYGIYLSFTFNTVSPYYGQENRTYYT